MGSSFGAEFKAANPDEVGDGGVVKVCICGGAGFIGSHIAKRLRAEVSCVTNCSMMLSHAIVQGCYVVCADWKMNEFMEISEFCGND